MPGDGSHDWIGWARAINSPYRRPRSGRLVNANDRIAPPDFPTFLGRDWFADWRSRRIRELLDRSEQAHRGRLRRMQIDVRPQLRAPDSPGAAGHAPPEADAARRAQGLLKDWDGSMTVDRPQPLIFNAWVQHFYGLVLRQADIDANDGGPQAEFVAYVLSLAGSTLVRRRLHRDPEGGARRGGGGSGGALRQRTGAWRWGEAHPAVFAHPVLRALPVLGPLTTLSIPSPGDDTTIDRGGIAYGQFQSVHGAAYRGVYDLADLDRSLFIVAPGQSGNPLSRHARDFLARWRDGATVTLGANA